jgi:hypothetical protein
MNDKRYNDYVKGKRIENVCLSLLESRGFKCRMSTRTQDRLEGWDILVESAPLDLPLIIKDLVGQYIDVKGIKSEDNKYNWIELVAYTSTNQKLGWLFRGKSNIIAFQGVKGFLFVEKRRIIDFVFKRMPELKNMYLTSKTDNTSVEGFEFDFLRKINENWDNFNIITDIREKDNAIYEDLYSRPQYDHDPDLLFKIKTTDLLEMNGVIIKW